jgi:DNA-binding Lrp family transcriptional regulator
MPEETAQFGWDALAKMLGKSKRNCQYRRKKLQDAGVISYTTALNSGGHPYRAMFFFSSVVKAYLARRSMEGEKF